MIRTLSTLLLLTALAGPAAAQEVTISLAGKDAKTLRADIDKAAWSVCTQAFLSSRIAFAEQADCARGAADDAEAQVKAYSLTTADLGSVSVLAVNDSRSAPQRQ